MRPHLTLFPGIFCMMALSNAIIPVLPSFGEGSSVHGIIFAAYFFGAFLVTIPAGILADRFGTMPFIRFGLVMTVTSGILFLAGSGLPLVIFARFLEGLGAGCFVTAALSFVNGDPDHVRLSSWYMASMNSGLVAGLLATGWLASYLAFPLSGIILFSVLAIIPCIASFFLPEPDRVKVPFGWGTITGFIADYRWLWFSAIILIGITGVVSAMYPKFSGATPTELGIWTSCMNAATIIAVLACPYFRFTPVTAIRVSAAFMAASVVIAFFSPAGFLALGALAGIIMIAQMALLAGVPGHQGVIMGLYASASYLGMALLPAAAGFVAEGYGFTAAFSLAALAALSVAGTIGLCSCREKPQ